MSLDSERKSHTEDVRGDCRTLCLSSFAQEWFRTIRNHTVLHLTRYASMASHISKSGFASYTQVSCHSTLRSAQPFFKISLSMKMSKTTPIVFVGRIPQIATGIIEGLKPEIEGISKLCYLKFCLASNCATRQIVIHHIVEVESAIVQIPAIMQGERHVPCDTSSGTHNYTRNPVAVLIGAWYGEQMICNFQASLEDPASLYWLRVDKNIPSPPLGPEYSKVVAARVKSKLLEVTAQGKSVSTELILV